MPNPLFSKFKSKTSSSKSYNVSAQPSETDSMDTSSPSTPTSSENPMNTVSGPHNISMEAMQATTSTITIAPAQPSTHVIESEAIFREVYQCAKLNSEWYHVSRAVKEHPDWLLRVPEGRKWTMLHQIVFSGNVNHVKEVLSFQLDNPNFSILHKSQDDKTIRDVAQERAGVYPLMVTYIDTLIACDKILTAGKTNKWDDVLKLVREKPDLVNEKPPYRRFYLIHHLALVGSVDIFKKINQIKLFDLTVTANGKTAIEIAKENNQKRFVDYLENLPSPPTESEASASSASSGPPKTTQKKYSPGFYDDVAITIIPPDFDFDALAASVSTHNPGYGGYGISSSHHHHHHAVHASASVPLSHAASSSHASGGKKKPSLAKTTPEEDKAYEEKVTSNIGKVSSDEITNLITCPITKQIMRDPVIAADGFTYEHNAILEWFNSSDRSPMTNQPLDNYDLKPNQSIKSLLKTLEASGKSATNGAKKS